MSWDRDRKSYEDWEQVQHPELQGGGTWRQEIFLAGPPDSFHPHSPPWVGTALLDGINLPSSWPCLLQPLLPQLPNVGHPLPSEVGETFGGRKESFGWRCADGQRAKELESAGLKPIFPEGSLLWCPRRQSQLPREHSRHISLEYEGQRVLLPCNTPPVGPRCGDLPASLRMVTAFWGCGSRTCTRGHRLHRVVRAGLPSGRTQTRDR